ncbi:MAG: 23S rRNA (pseudouridine(1915)-N(3))-methyltransferase RlmH [Clostridiales bacterium]|nr:23S rRNA (pseudouridine(1915)-N(3))-methyltransferase RlmH [Clostridiales bacterium]
MKITVIGVGRLKEKYWRDAVNEYCKRLSKYVKLEIIEIPDEKAPETLSAAEEDIVKKNEGERILKSIKDGAYVIALAIDGKALSSEELSDFINERMVRGIGHIVFVIGGSLGLSDDVFRRADYKLSFSKMTFPHQMMRVILLEQFYRAIKIMRNEPYHK